VRACAACVRAAQTLKTLTPDLDRRPGASRPPEVLTLLPEAMVEALREPGSPRPAVLDRTDDDLLSEAASDHRRLGVESVCRHDPAYPARLRELGDPPAVLHVLGGAERLAAVLGPAGDAPTVSMVGSRRGPRDTTENARRFAEAFARAGWTVVSGMALGVDAASHEGALAGRRAGPTNPGRPSGTTVAVLAAGVERPTPATNRRLYERIALEGVVVSELPPGATPRRWSFPARNRIIAALGDALIVVAAARGSGSLWSSDHAETLKRPVGVVPGPILDPAYAGSNALLREDAIPLIEPDDLRTILGAPGKGEPPVPRADPLAGLDGVARAIGAALLAGPRTIESLVADHDPPALLAALGDLEAAGRLRRGLSGELELVSPRAF
jgi:DNA processing protein